MSSSSTMQIAGKDVSITIYDGPFPTSRYQRNSEKLCAPKVRILFEADFFDGSKEHDAAFLGELWALVTEFPNLDWLLVTSHPENIRAMVPPRWFEFDRASHPILSPSLWPSNVWLGAKVSSQEDANARIPHMTALPAASVYLSFEGLDHSIDFEYPKAIFPDGPGMCCNGYMCGCMGQPIDAPIIYGVHWAIGDFPEVYRDPDARPRWFNEIFFQLEHWNIPLLYKGLNGPNVAVSEFSESAVAT